MCVCNNEELDNTSHCSLLVWLVLVSGKSLSDWRPLLIASSPCHPVQRGNDVMLLVR